MSRADKKQPAGARQRPVERRPGENLTSQVIAALRRKVSDDKLQPGDRLPTEKELIDEFGVSRTVIREAISSLRADGLVEPRQGAGVFVRELPEESLRIPLFTGKLEKISEILEVLELRAAVEIEAAGLAAERRSFGQEAKIKEAYDDLTLDIDSGGIAEDQDYRYHLAIAEATGNPLFVEFLEFLGKRTIPRSQLLRQGVELEDRVRLLNDVHREHMQILKAISDQDVEAARDAMRGHLVGSRERYRALIYRDP